jgi:nitrite reductase/ring-hydroxylating ferredoxin subunit
MGKWASILSAAELREGEPVECVVAGLGVIALFRVGDDAFATDSVCTHGAARLCEGFQEGFAIECPLHQGRFDVRTGQCLAPPVTKNLRVYATRLADGHIEVEIPEAKP